MHPARRQRLIIVLFIVVGASVAAALVFNALNQNMNLFYPPTEVVSGKAPVGKHMRVGGMVVNGSVQRDPGSLKVRFEVTDYAAKVPVEYEGILPDLFSEGEGIVTSGVLQDNGVFKADEVLAKHDENYMPPEVAGTLQKKPAFVHDAPVHEQPRGEHR